MSRSSHSVRLRVALAFTSILLAASTFAAAQSAMDQFNSVYGSKSAITGAHATAPDGSAVSLAQVEKVGRKLDILGVYLGMPAKAAIAAIHAHDSSLTPQPESFKMSDLPDQTFTSYIGFRSHSQGGAVDDIDLGLTTQPMQSVVMNITRHVEYTESNHPTLAATIAAFHSKYGPESDSKPKDPTNTYTFFWIYDENGQKVTGQAAKMLSEACTGIRPNYMQQSIVSGFDGKMSGQDCSRYSYLQVEIEEWGPRRTNRLGQSEPPGMVFQMHIGARSIPLQIASSDATRKMLFAARTARQQKEKKAAGDNAPVL